jgi:hypothetical protein
MLSIETISFYYHPIKLKAYKRSENGGDSQGHS